MTPNNLVPGIANYPELEKALSVRMSNLGRGCGSCQLSSVARDFRARLKARVERDKIQGKR